MSESAPIPGLFIDPLTTQPTDVPMLSPSTADLIIGKSPLHAWHHKWGGEEPEYTEATDIGTIAHSLILGGADIVPVEADSWRTNAAKAQRDAARAEGKLPILVSKLEEVKDLVDHVSAYFLEHEISLAGAREATVIWKERNLDVWCKGKLDHWLAPGILDLKFVANAHPAACGKSAINYGYDIQAAAYTSAVETIFPELAGRVRFLFVFVETAAPYAITVGRPGGVMRALGQAKWLRACETWKRCLAEYGTAKPWPGYAEGVVELDAPKWAIDNEAAIQDLEIL